ncbi:MAG: helix-turn-helix domain-containing protein [Deltaproteobacteria bacterium]|jgi:phage repressor protein C with HTH and peptisase S24 domain|nr:helix-turn-helix domain-containing protein [Deltaproteobacteria bacterium]
MPISFDDFFARACEASGAKTQMELASILGVNRSAITQAKNRDAVPEKWLLSLSRKFAVSPDWLEHGGKYQKNILKPLEGNFARCVTAGSVQPAFRHDEPDGDFSEIVSIPKISAVLCAGGGSFEVENAVIDYIPLLSPFVRKLGNPSGMVFMDVSGDSMEPGIFHGDTVLIDQSVKNFQSNSIMAVGHDETIFIKRLQSMPGGGLALLSDNPAYEPIRLAGDELASFRVLGKLVWLFRKVQ